MTFTHLFSGLRERERESYRESYFIYILEYSRNDFAWGV